MIEHVNSTFSVNERINDISFQYMRNEHNIFLLSNVDLAIGWTFVTADVYFVLKLIMHCTWIKPVRRQTQIRKQKSLNMSYYVSILKLTFIWERNNDVLCGGSIYVTF